MTRFIHDKFAKDYLEELLKPYGKVEAPKRVAGEVREIDVFFSPFLSEIPNLEILGLLGYNAKKLHKIIERKLSYILKTGNM